MNKSRMEAFTDAILAIVMTIMVLELKAPDVHSIIGMFSETKEIFLIYFISYLLIVISWINHHHIFQVAKKINGLILWVNMLWLLSISIIPFATSWVGDNFTYKEPLIFYGLIISVNMVMYFFLVKAVVYVNGPGSMVAKVLNKNKKSLISISVMVLSIVANIFIQYFVVIGLVVVIVVWFIPYRSVEKELSEKREE